MNKPVISIITVAKNSEKYIESTIKSVLSQDYDKIEFIVIDGASTDNTQNIIEKYAERIDAYCSESDSGIAEAMNKGVAKASGDYLLFLNSDDYLAASDAISMAVSAMTVCPADIQVFRVRFLYEDGRAILSLNHSLGLLTNFKMGSCHQGQFIPRQLFNHLHGFDTSLSINFDYDWLLRAYRSGASSQSHAAVIAVMRQVGISSRRDWAGFRERYDEERRVHFKNCPNVWMRLIYHCYWSLYIPYRYLRYLFIAANRKFLKNKSIKALQ